MDNVLVTGATGFIGRSLCRDLKVGGKHVRAMLRDRVDGPWHETAYMDLEGEIPSGIFDGVDTAFHLAGKAHALSEGRQEEEEYFRINTEGTRKLLLAAQQAGVRRFVFFSSVKAAGEGGAESMDETAHPHPGTPYGASKLAAEKLVLEEGFVPEPVVLRLSMVYGNSDKGNLPRMIRAVAKGRFPPLPEVSNKRSMVHVDDVVQAAMLAAERPEASGQTYIVTDGTPYSTRQIYDWICEALGRPVPNWSLPIPMLRVLARVGDGIGHLRGKRFMFDSDALEKLIGSAWYSSRKLEEELGFRPQHHLHESLPEIIPYLSGLNA